MNNQIAAELDHAGVELSDEQVARINKQRGPGAPIPLKVNFL